MIRDLKISEAVFGDLEQILEVQYAAFESEAVLYGSYDIEPLKQSIDSICSDFGNHVFLKAVANGRIIGSVKVKKEGDTAFVGKLIVLPEYRRNGIGRKLLLAAGNAVKAKKYLLYTGSKSVNNIRLYESAGYKIVGRRPDEKSSDVILVEMEKNC